MKVILGVGVDLTQHVPLVSKALCPEPALRDGRVDTAALAQHWPPPVELQRGFRPQPPVCLLPLVHGEPALVGDAAAQHRRAAGLSWPPEARVPDGVEDAAGLGRVPLFAAWAALLPPPDQEESMTRRADPEFGWYPDGRNISVRAGQMLALSLRAFLHGAGEELNTCRIAVVVPDALDEAGQQILLDACAESRLDPEKIHLLPRPLAAALRWCHADNRVAALGDATDDEEGRSIGRLRVLTTSLDVWEALPLEVRARRHFNRVWLVPVRDRVSLGEARPELGLFGVTLAAALARVQGGASLADWWRSAFAGPWLNERLQGNNHSSPEETRHVQAVLAGRVPDPVRHDFRVLGRYHSIWAQFAQDGSGLRRAEQGFWAQQERSLGISSSPLLGITADGTFSRLVREYAAELLSQSVTTSSVAAVHGAALAAAAIAHDLPCYREKLLPLDLCVRAEDKYGDPLLQWKALTASASVEAGRTWRSPEPITGLKIDAGKDHLVLPLRRSLKGRSAFRRVATELAKPAKRNEAVRVEVEVKPGQGYARVRIASVTPGVFGARLDWRTMEECDEPTRPPLAYIPGVSRIDPDREMFEQAEPTMRAALQALDEHSPQANDRLCELIRLLNKWPLAHNFELRRGRVIEKDVMLHYGVIGSEGKLDALPAPALARGLQKTIGERFSQSLQGGRRLSQLGANLLRAGGWFYLAMPRECYRYLHARLREAGNRGRALSAVELHAIGLACVATEDLRCLYPLVVQALSNPATRPNNWLRAVRNICRFRNHALCREAVSDTTIADLVRLIYSRLREQVNTGNFGMIFRNCLETIPFLLKRRRYDPAFLPPGEEPALGIINFLEAPHVHHRWRLPDRLQEVPRVTIKLLRMQATDSDLEALLGAEDEEEDND